MHRFKEHITNKYQLELRKSSTRPHNSRIELTLFGATADYAALQKWSAKNIAEFWSEVWDWGDSVVASKRWTEVS
jgi:hypothetical protein